MRRLPVALLVLAAGCRSQAEHLPPPAERRVADLAPHKVVPPIVPCAAPAARPDGPLDLPALWDLALANNPTLREAAAEVEVARGRLIQAGAYPNPRILFHLDELGSSIDAAGNPSIEVTQEVLTAGKRRLDRAAAGRGLDAAGVALLGRKYEALTRVRRAYYDVMGQAEAVRVSREVAASLAEGVEVTRKLVEEVKTRPRTDLLRLQALLDQARIGQARSQANLEAAWRQLAAEVGLPGLPRPDALVAPADAVPVWQADAVERRVQSVHTDLSQAALEADRLRLEFERTRAEAVPNVTVGGGYIRSFIEQTGGAVVSVETSLPLWDRKQGRIHEARARWAQAEAAERSAAARLSRETAEAFAHYEGARQQAQRLAEAVVPKLDESLKLVREGYQAGAAGVSFTDVQLAVEARNDARLRLAEARRELWRAVADLQGLMQLDLGEELDSRCGERRCSSRSG